MKEIWKDVVGYSGFYEVSNLGNVRSVDRVVSSIGRSAQKLKGRILKTNLMGTCGRLAVSLSKDGVVKRRYVHQLVAEAFIGPRSKGQEIRHGIKGVLNNHLDNLSYGTTSENGLDKRRDGTHGGKAVRRSDGVEFINLHEAAEATGCGVSGISQVCNGLRRSCSGYSWEFINKEDKIIKQKKPKVNNRLGIRKTPVKRSDGVIFDTIRQAAKSSNCSPSDICSVCRGKKKTAGGFTWEYVEINEKIKGEDWRDIVGYEGYYQVSNLGRVRSVNRTVKTKNNKTMVLKGQILKPTINCQNSIFQVNLTKNHESRARTVHQLVAEAFLGACPDGLQILHGPNGRIDNSATNLSYGTPQQNSLDKRRDRTHRGRAVRCLDTNEEYINLTVASEETGCDSSCIGRVCKGKQKTVNGLRFEYID